MNDDYLVHEIGATLRPSGLISILVGLGPSPGQAAQVSVALDCSPGTVHGRSMPVVLRIDGLRFLFYSNEGSPREPPHVHVLQGRDEAKFWLAPEVSLVYNDGFSARQINRIQKLVAQNRESLETAWHEHFA